METSSQAETSWEALHPIVELDARWPGGLADGDEDEDDDSGSWRGEAELGPSPIFGRGRGDGRKVQGTGMDGRRISFLSLLEELGVGPGQREGEIYI